MRKREGFEQITIEYLQEKKIKERLKKLADLKNRSVNKQAIDLLEEILEKKEKRMNLL
ncbi:hypothetical protein [Candidatus Parabeggiatoa sp. HSG14]|uniref:hypothetical protein n=1 Tax=Candidatus Parabeggiatoa sp. HSG14 TaxID=3055593 RepID=UPI0025A7AF34|nr:hypothetical protein [Thiotrichales bacterium HSG14]